MRSFKRDNLTPTSKQQHQKQVYSPTRTATYQNPHIPLQPPPTIPSTMNKNRTQQIVLLHEQFEDLKRKIKQVENNNQKIIQKIHRECNFKKKTPQQVFDTNVNSVETKPIVYYEKKEKKVSQLSQHSGMSIDESNKSDQSEFQFRQRRKPSTRGLSGQNNNYLPSKTFTQSMQYNRVQLPTSKQANKSLLNKKSSKLSQQHQPSKYLQHQQPNDEESLENINTSQQLVQDDFDQQQGVEIMNMQYQHEKMIQGSVKQQGYDYSGEFSGGNGSSTGKSSSGKKGLGFTTSYPLSQQHMLTHSAFGININQSPSETRTPTLNTQQPPRVSTSSKQQFTIYQLQQSLKIQKQKITYLEQQLKSKQLQILNIKKDYNRLTTQLDSVEMIVEDNLEYFLENVVKKRFFEMEKAIKKNQNRLRNMAINVKDSYQEVKSNKIIREHQLLRRSNSRSKRDTSPRNTSFHQSGGNNPLAQSTLSPLPNQPQAKIPRPSSSYANGFYQPPNIIPPSLSTLPPSNPLDKRSRISQQSKKNKQLEQIVHKYQQMIHSKREQITKLQQSKSLLQKKNQKLSKQLQAKQSQVRQIRQKLDQLQKLMSQTYNQLPITRTKPFPALRVIKPNNNANRPISSVESNLLQDIEQELDNDDMVLEIVKMERMHEELKQQLVIKNEKIKQLEQVVSCYEVKTAAYQSEMKTFEQRVRAYQQKITKLQSTLTEPKPDPPQKLTSSTISLLDTKLTRQKLQLEIKTQLTQTHKKQLSMKQQQIIQIRNIQITLEKKLVQKDCQMLTLMNKIKKLQGAGDILQTKVEEYEKLLNQHNTSVDLMNESQFVSLLDRSLCGEDQSSIKRSSHNAFITAQKRIITVSYQQLQSMQCQVRQSLQQILQLTKKIKSLQRTNQQQTVEIDKLQQDNQLLMKQKHLLSKQITQLKNQLKQLEEKIEDMNDGESEVENNRGRMEFGVEERRSDGYERSAQRNNNNNYNSNNNVSSSGRYSQLRLSTTGVQTRQQDPIAHMQQTIQRLQSQLSTFKSKNIQLSAQYNTLKQQILQSQRNIITLQKDKQYLQQSLSDRQMKYQRVKRQYEELKVRNSQLQEFYNQKEEQLRREKDENCAKIQELERQWHQFQQQINNNNNPSTTLYDSLQPPIKEMDRSQLLKTSRYNVSQSSILLSSTIHNKNSQYLQQQNQYLTIKLKQAQATIEMHNMMQEKVVNEYKGNVERLRGEMKQKSKQCEGLRKELEMVSDAKRRLEIMYQSSRNYLAQSRSNHSQVRSRQLSEVSNRKSQSQLTQVKQQKQPQTQQQNFQMEQFPSYCQDSNNMSLLSGYSPNSNPNPINSQQSRLYPYQRIIQLECQLKQAKDINKKLQQMQQQLFKQIKLKQQQKKDLMRLIDEKNVQIQELEEIVELKEQNLSHANIINSHLSSNYKHSSQSRNNLSQRQSLHSHSSLRYSGITHSRFPTNQPHYPQQPSINTLQVMGASQMGQSQRFQIQFSQTGSQMLDKSYVTNISQIFQKQQFPYQKVQLKRKQQIKLFQKTASYIKSLKDSITQKNKRIKLLQKKIQSLKSNHHGQQLLCKQIESKYQISTKVVASNDNNTNINNSLFQFDNNNNNDDLSIQFESVFKDYESVQIQLQRKKASHNKRYKTLEHQWKLAIEENNVLVNQVQVLQQQLQKAQQQQNSILVMKDLYKQQIKKLLAKNESQTAYYEQLLGKQRKKVQQSQSVHNIETIKQLFLKVMDAIIVMQSEKMKKKREEKKRQLEQLFAIFASLCAIEEGKRLAVLDGLKRMTLNIVLAEQGRSSSKSRE